MGSCWFEGKSSALTETRGCVYTITTDGRCMNRPLEGRQAMLAWRDLINPEADTHRQDVVRRSFGYPGQAMACDPGRDR